MKQNKKYALITHHDEKYQSLARYTWFENKIKYAIKHGYDYHAKTGDWVSSLSGFEKIYFARQILEENPNYEWIWWTGTDTLITNFLFKIEDRIDNNYHFMISSDILGLNADSFLVRNTAEGKKFLDDVINLKSETSKHWDSEQRAICNILDFPETGNSSWPYGKNLIVKNKYKSVVKIMHQRFMNSFNYYLYDVYKNVPHRDKKGEDGNWQFGDWLIHWPATTLEYRHELAQFYQQFIIE